MNNRAFFSTWAPLIGATLVYFCACMQKVIVPGTTFDEIQKLFQIGAEETARLGAAFCFIYAALQLAAGPLADRFGGAKVITVSGLVFVLGSFFSAVAPSASLLLASRIVVGAGAAMMAQAVLKMTDRIAGKKLSVVFGMVTLFGYSGSIAGTSPFAAGVRAFGYRAMMLAAALLAGFALVLHWTGCAADHSPETQKPAPFSLSRWFRCFSRRNVLFFFAMGIPFATTFSFLAVFGKKFLEDYTYMTPVQSGGILFGMTLIAAVNGVIAAIVSRRCGDNNLMIMRYSSFGTFVLAVAWTVLLAADCRSKAAFGFIAFAFASTGNILPVYAAYLREHNDPDYFVTVNSIMNACAYVFTSFAAWGAGKCLGFFQPENVAGGFRYGRNAYLAIAAGLVLFSAVSVVCISFLPGKRSGAGS